MKKLVKEFLERKYFIRLFKYSRIKFLAYKKLKIILVIVSFLFIFLSGYFTGFINNNNSQKEADLHYSFFSKKEIFENAFKKSKKSPVKENVKGLIVPHHLLASKLIADGFNIIFSKEPLVVILIGPNHFFYGKGKIISSLYDWQTPYGVLESDKNLVRKISKEEKKVNIEESPFKREHSISGLVTFIKKSLPNAKIVPLIIKDTLSQEESDNFAYYLNKVVPQNSIIIASVDFSHNVPSKIADFQDLKSLEILKNFDYQNIDSLHADSKPALRILLRFSELQGCKNFIFLDHSNSSKILNNDKIPDVTSYITGYTFCY